ncbi:DUF4307 domain-containing protein [Streptomyces sp. E11-3]|uniref:DUF4307 domain-containing protein n=1 Tax=Streptomyces sp. E11-3 TaxID=3110112 RepID=UPI0039805126
MSAVPEGRYGRSADARADRKLKIVGAALGALLLGVVGWLGFHYVSAGNAFSGEMITFKVVSETEVTARLEIRKDPDTPGVCTLRALAESGAEVGRKDFSFDQREKLVVEHVGMRTTGKATSVDLLACSAV